MLLGQLPPVVAGSPIATLRYGSLMDTCMTIIRGTCTMSDRLEKMLRHVQASEQYWYNEGRRCFRSGRCFHPSLAPRAYRDMYCQGYVDEMSKPTAPVTLIQRIRDWFFGKGVTPRAT